jgi:nicotinamide riboside kinase
MIGNEIEITEEDWMLGEILQNPVMFREFINMDDPNWTPLEIHERAWTTCTKHFVSMCCGRGVHKTTSMIEMLYWWMVNGMYHVGDQGIFILVPNAAQKNITFNKIRSACEKHWFIRHFVRPNSINISEGRIDFVNGFQLLLRLAGEAGKETNVIGIHTYRIWVDEAQDLAWKTWQSLQNCLKEEIPGHQMLVSGVPNGGRQENVLYHADQVDERYIRFNISQEMMSWWTPEMEIARRVFYKAVQEDSEDYKHFVLGQHGAPSFTVFDRNRFQLVDYDPIKEIYTQNTFERIKKEKDGVVSYLMSDVIVCPPVPSEYGVRSRIGLGYDPGFSPDPAVFMIIYRDPKTMAWRTLVRYVLQRVEYAIQREVLRYLDQVYEFDFLGIDMGGIGKVQYQDLTGELSIYKERSFLERIFPVEFGGQMVVAIDEQGNEKKDLIKRVAVEMLSRWVYERQIEFAKTDDDLMTELERTKFTRTITGEPVYRTDDDHQMSALMCALMAYEHKFGVPIAKAEPNVQLLAARWLKFDEDELGVTNRW